MNELGFVITKDGEEFCFGEYHLYSERENDNKHYFHTPSFQEEVLKNEAFQKLNLNIPMDFEISHHPKTLASKGLVVALNQTAGTYTKGVPTILFLSPEELSEKQKEALLEKEEELTSFDSGLSYAYVIDEEEKEVRQYDFMEDYFTKR